MAVLYWTSDVKMILNNKVTRMMEALIETKDATTEGTVEVVKRIRMYKEFVDEVIADMEEMDQKEKEQREAEKREAEQRAKKDEEKKDAG